MTHRTFGSGKVVSRQGDIATILFEGGTGEAHRPLRGAPAAAAVEEPGENRIT